MAKKSHNYINNKDFSSAIIAYGREVARIKAEIAQAEFERRNHIPELPRVPDFIAMCFMKIANGLACRENFSGYSYIDDMVGDAIENCLQAVEKFNPDAVTRSGNPNAFAYFTQIAWWAFLRRIQKEQRQYNTKLKYMTDASTEHYVDMDVTDQQQYGIMLSHFENLRSDIDELKDYDKAVAEYAIAERKMGKSRRISLADSNLEEYLNDG